MKCSTRWWNAGRYEAECAAFDVAAPLSREVWESLQRSRDRSWYADFIVHPSDTLLLREPLPDLWQEFADRVYRRELERWHTANPMVFVGL